MDSGLVRVKVLDREITIPREVQGAAIGNSESSGKDAAGKDARRLGDFLSLNIMGQVWTDESLLKIEEFRTTFEHWKHTICKAIKEKNHLPFVRMADALEHAHKATPDYKMAIARAFILLRLRYGEALIPRDELIKESSRVHREIFKTLGPAKPLWSREFGDLGIRPFLTKGKPGPKTRKPN
jgi:hypothetical protein